MKTLKINKSTGQNVTIIIEYWYEAGHPLILKAERRFNSKGEITFNHVY